MVRTYVQQIGQGTGPRSYGGWPKIMIFAQLEGVHIGVYTTDKMARKSPLYKAREAGLPTATKKVMLQWGETTSGEPRFWNILPPGVASRLPQAPGRRKVVRQGAGPLEDELPETTTIFEMPLDGLCLFHALARVWNEMYPQDTRRTGQGMKRNLLEKMEDTRGRTVEGQTLAQIIREDGWAEAQEEGHKQGTQQTHNTSETTQEDGKARRCDAEPCAAPRAEPRYPCDGWHIEPQAVHTAGRRWRTIRSVVHVEGGLHVGGDSAVKRTCGVPSLWRRREDRREVRAQRQTMYLWGHSARQVHQ